MTKYEQHKTIALDRFKEIFGGYPSSHPEDQPRIARLPIKRKWFDMILSGEKEEEYREIKKYWEKRLWQDEPEILFLHAGYGDDKPSMFICCDEIRKGWGFGKWGAPAYPIYICELGEILCSYNHEQT